MTMILNRRVSQVNNYKTHKIMDATQTQVQQPQLVLHTDAVRETHKAIDAAQTPAGEQHRADLADNELVARSNPDYKENAEEIPTSAE